MSSAKTQALIASLELQDKFTPVANRALASTKQLDSAFATMGKNIGGHIQKGMGAAAQNVERGVALIGAAIGSQIVFGIQALKDEQAALAQTGAVLKSTGSVAGISAQGVRALAESLSQLGGTDEDVIQSGANLLLTFTNIRNAAGAGNDIFNQATLAALNMSRAMDEDLNSAVIRLGKALQDPVKGATALRKVGVMLTDDQTKQIATLVKHNRMLDAQKIILRELNVEFGGSEKAYGETAPGALAKFGVAVEEAQKALARGLLPVMAEVANEANAFLSDPQVLAGIEAFSKELGAGMRDAFAWLKTLDWNGFSGALKTAAGAARGFVSAFTSMPSWLQEVLVGMFVANKLTGGMVTGIIGELGKGLIKGVLGMNAAVVNINAAVVNGGGGGGPVGTVANTVTKLAPESIAAILAGAGTVAAGVGLTLGMGYLPQLNPFGNGPAQDRTVASGPMAGTTLPATGYMSIDALSGGNAALAGLIQANTKPSTLGRDMDKNIVSGITAAEKKLSREDAANAAVNAQKIRDAINRAANDARDNVHVQLAGQLDAKKAIKDAVDIVGVYTSGTAKNTDWINRNEQILTALQQRFAAQGDTVTAARIAAELQTLQSIDRTGLSSIQTAVAGMTPVVNNYTGFVTGTQSVSSAGHTTSPGSTSSGGSTSGGTSGTGGGNRMNASGVLGLTQGLTSIGWAGEAGREAVAIIRDPKPLQAAKAAAQPLTVHLHTTVSARQNEAAHVSQNRWGPTRVLQGARG